jgi:hypothetical protein
METAYGLMRETAPEALHELDPLFGGTAFGTALFAGGIGSFKKALRVSGQRTRIRADFAFDLWGDLGNCTEIIRKRV